MKPKLYRSLLTQKRTIVHIDNGGKYSRDYLECTVWYDHGIFTAYITNGFKVQKFHGFGSLKEALAWGSTQLELRQVARRSQYVEVSHA